MKTPDDEERASQEIGHGGIRDLREAGFEVVPAARLREREAQAAAIRGALVEWLALHEEALRSREDAIRIYNSGQLPTVVQKCKEALTSPDPGKPFLDRIAALEEALKPFLTNAHPHTSWPDESPIGIPNITIGHVRRAAALLEQKGVEPG